MDRFWYFLFLFWSNVIFGTTVFLFQRGFLLTREVLHDRSECPKAANNDSCYQIPRQYSKAIVLLIDALRYDFLLHDKNISPAELKPYQNAIPIVSQLIEKGHGKLYQSFADPPTTTMQRLKGLTTGSIPTFIDISSNFASYEIDEDNIIDQMINRGRRVVFAGDDTWMSLFPNKFTRTYPYPSFDVWDLDTVDRGVEKHLFKELKHPDQWDVFIGHFLGVDHVGHKHGPSHSEMRRKLIEMNYVINKTVQMMPDDCVLFVMGDHGMTATGDHGGDSENELNSALFIYSKRWNQNDLNKSGTRISQVDFVPTFSLLMGLPIPFSNVGKVIYDAFFPNGLRQLQYLKINVEQVFTYLTRYQSAFGDQLPDFESIDEKRQSFMNRTVLKPAQVPEDVSIGIEILESVKQRCQAMFVEFDSLHIWMGLTVSCLHICLMVVLSLDKVFLKSVVTAKLFLALGLSFAIGSLLSSTFIFHHFDVYGFFVNLAWITVPVCSLSILWRIRHSIGSALTFISETTDFFSIFHIVVGISVCAGLFSNSFVVEEGQIYAFVVLSVVLLHALKQNLIFQSRRNFLLALTFMALLRVTTIYFRCREEQQGYCSDNEFDFHKPVHTLDQSVSREYKNWRFGATVLSAFMMAYLPLGWLTMHQSLQGFSLPVIVVNYVYIFNMFALISQWALQCLPEELASKYLPGAWQHNAMAISVYASAFLSLFVIVAQPKFVYFEQRRSTEMPRVYRGTQTLFKMMRANWQEYFKDSRKGQIIGLGACVSAPLISMGLFLLQLSMLLLGDGLTPSLFIIVTAMSIFLYMDTSHRLRQAEALTDLMHVPWTSVISWSLFENLFFYGTGHQPTFNTIQWTAAFVGFSGANYGGGDEGLLGLNYWLPAFLIGWNTYVSRILFAFLLPLLLVAPFSIFKILSSDESRLKKEDKKSLEDEGEGNLVTMEGEETNSHLFRLCIRYSVISGLRMFASMATAAYQRRHLMSQKIFTPRFIFEAVGFGISLVTMCLSYLTFMRVHGSLSRYVQDLNKTNNE